LCSEDVRGGVVLREWVLLILERSAIGIVLVLAHSVADEDFGLSGDSNAVSVRNVSVRADSQAVQDPLAVRFWINENS